MRTSMNPPPPMFPAAGSTTARANAVATAASTALPPFCKTSTPACEASSSSVATIPCAPRTGSVGHDFSVSARSLYGAAFCAGAPALAQQDTTATQLTHPKNVCFFISSSRYEKFPQSVKGTFFLASGSETDSTHNLNHDNSRGQPSNTNKFSYERGRSV